MNYNEIITASELRGSPSSESLIIKDVQTALYCRDLFYNKCPKSTEYVMNKIREHVIAKNSPKCITLYASELIDFNEKVFLYVVELLTKYGYYCGQTGTDPNLGSFVLIKWE